MASDPRACETYMRLYSFFQNDSASADIGKTAGWSAGSIVPHVMVRVTARPETVAIRYQRGLPERVQRVGRENREEGSSVRGERRSHTPALPLSEGFQAAIL